MKVIDDESSIVICLGTMGNPDCLYSMSLKKGNPGLTPNFSKSQKDITNWVHDSIIILLSFGCMATQQSIL